MSGGIRKGQNIGGIRTIEDLRQRSVIDEITGCWNVRSATRRGNAVIWLHFTQKAETLTGAMALLMTGARAERGTCWFAACGNRACGNPDHRKFGTLSEAQRSLREPKSPMHRKKLADSMLARFGNFSPELRHEILTSSESAAAIARRVGMHPSQVSRIRRGDAWRDHAVGASVFHLGTAA